MATTIPDFTALGQVATPQPANAVATYNPNAPFEAQQQVGAAVEKSGQDVQDLYDKAVVQDAYANKFSPAVDSVAQDYYSKQGKDAVDGLEPAQQQINTTYNTIKGDMTGKQAEMFAGLAQGRMGMESYRMSIHSGQQLDKYNELATSAMGTDLVNRAQNGSFLNDPTGAAAAVNGFKNTIAQAPSMAGMPPALVTEKQNEFEQNFNKANSTAAINYVTSLPTDQQIQALQPAVDRHAGTPVTTAEDAIKFVMYKQEGGATVVPNDSGYGPSKFGILGSKNGLDATTTAGLTDDRATQIYKAQYWDKAGIDNLPDKMKLPAFDTVVNFGLDGGGKLIQEAGNDPQKLLQLRQQKYDDLVSDDPGRYGAAQAGWQTRQNNLAQAMARGTGQPTGTLLDNIKQPELMTLYKNAQTQQKLDQAANGELVKQQQLQASASLFAKTDPSLPPEQKLTVNDVYKAGSSISQEQQENLLNWLNKKANDGAVDPDKNDPAVIRQRGILENMKVDNPLGFQNFDFTTLAGQIPGAEIAKFQGQAAAMHKGDGQIAADNKRAKEVTDSIQTMLPWAWHNPKDQSDFDNLNSFKGQLISAVHEADQKAGKPLGTPDVQKLASGMLANVAVPGKIWGTNQEPLWQARKNREETSIQIPPDFAANYTASLQKIQAGMKPTPSEILDAYEHSLGAAQ